MKQPELSDEVWRAALGASPAHNFPVHHSWFWTHETEGPHDAVHLHREIEARIRARGGDVAAATQVGLDLRRQLQEGEQVAIGVEADGTTIMIPAALWGGFGEVAERLWYWAEYVDPARPGHFYRVFLRRRTAPPDWWPKEKQNLKSWCDRIGLADAAARERLKARGKPSPSETAVCTELSAMWREAGRKGGSPDTIYITRKRMR